MNTVITTLTTFKFVVAMFIISTAFSEVIEVGFDVAFRFSTKCIGSAEFIKTINKAASIISIFRLSNINERSSIRDAR